jgi:hypothetical protein
VARGAAAGLVAALSAVVALVGALPAGGADGGADADVQRALRAVADLRRRFEPAPASTEDRSQALTWRGRPALEVEGRAAGAAGAGTLRDSAIFDLGSGRVASFTWFPHASTRRAGEAIISLSEVSLRADAHVRSLFPGSDLHLEGIERQRESGGEGVYYEASFASPSGEFPFLQPPVRLLLDASTGNLFRFDAEPAWLAPPRLSAAHLSRRAAERVAAAALRSRDLAIVLGAGAALGKVAAAELFVVQPNGWLGAPGEVIEPDARIAWVVPFSLAGGGAGHRLFVDATTGRVLGGMAAGTPAAR